MNKDIKNKNKYFIYARKSSESEDRQMASIDAQINELQKLAEDNGLNVIEVLSESKSAKGPGREIFNKMLERIHNGEAQGIICWKLNRLARNPIDGGQISWMLQQGSIQHIQTYGRSYYPADNVIMMAVELGMANQFIRDLSVDTKRGLRAKAERGWYPTYSTLGYIHNPYKKKGEREIINDPERFELVRKMFDLMLTGRYSVNKIWQIARGELSLTSKQNKLVALSTVYRIFNDTFYYGDFEYPKGSANWQTGKHNPMITRQEFDQIQVLLGKKSTSRPKMHDFAFRGPILCGECGALITAESKVKRQKNGNVHFYTYYHCTKKKHPECSQQAIEETQLQKQISNVLGEIELPSDFCEWALDVLKSNNVVEAQSRTQIIGSHRKEYDRVLSKLDGLIDMRASGDITSEEFVKNKTAFLEEKHRLEMLMGDVGQRADDWLERAEKYFEFAQTAKNTFDKTDSLEVKKTILMFLGSNLTLKDRILSVSLEKPLMYIKEASNEVKAMRERLEPAKNGLVEKDLRDYYPLNPKMLRG
ncbi:MAG: recombinase family protein [Minisyncoccia bacterium]